MATPFDTDFDNGDFIEVDHVKQFAQPINNLESRIINTSAPLTGGGDLTANRTISMPPASASQNGYLTSANFTAFAGKQNQSDKLDDIAALSMAKGDILVHNGTDLTKIGPGSNGQVLSADSGAGTGLSWVTPSGGGGGGGVPTSRLVATSAPLSGGGDLTADRTISISQASSSAPGYLTAADWTNFNGKQNVLSAPGDIPGMTAALAAKADLSAGKVPVAQIPTAIPAANIGNGDVDNTELSHLNGVTSPIQTQLNSKLSGTVPVNSGGTGATNAAGARTNLGVQAQSANLDQISSQSMAKGDILVHNGTGVVKMSPGSNGQVLAADSTAGTGLQWVAQSGGVPSTRQVATNAPLSGGGDLSADRTLSIAKATASVDGYLAATDFTNFNGKQNALSAPGDVPGMTSALAAKEDKSAKGSANGYASLDASGKVPSAQLPSAGSHTHAASDITSGTLSLARGGTGASSASSARTNLGVPGGAGSQDRIALWSSTNNLSYSRSPVYLHTPAIKGGGYPILYWNNSTGEVFGQYSRGAHKKDIKPLSTSIEELMTWRAVEFSWKEAFGGEEDIGLIAEEVASVFPRAAIYDQAWEYTDKETGRYAVNEDGSPQKISGEMVPAGVRYEKAWLPMLAAVQDFYRRFQELSDEVSSLRQQLKER